MKKNLLIGFSTQAFKPLPVNECIDLIHFNNETNSIELNFATIEIFQNFEMNISTFTKLKYFDFISIHAPWKNLFYHETEEIAEFLRKLSDLINLIKPRAVVLHPNIADLEYIKKYDLPLAIENMDKRKTIGVDPIFFRNLDFNSVLDVQHIYEWDKSIKIFNEFIQEMKNISHIHLSGETESKNHSPLIFADNAKAIIKFLELNKDFFLSHPIILEGLLGDDYEINMKTEVEFIKKILLS